MSCKRWLPSGGARWLSRPAQVRSCAWTLSLAGVFAASLSHATTPTPAATATPSLSPTAAATPNYNNVDDPLHGQRILVDVTDLVVADPIPNGSSSTTPQNLILDTNEGMVASETQAAQPSVACYASPPAAANFPQQTRIGRLFNQINDVLVTLMPLSTASGANCNDTSPNLVVSIEDELSSGNDSQFQLSTSGAWVQTTMTDFNFDGYDDLLVMNDQEMFVLTAADVNDPTKGLNGSGPVAKLTAAQTPLYEPVTGDFNGDGLIDFAWIGTAPPASNTATINTLTVYVATVCPTSVSNTICAGAQAFQIIQSSATIPLTLFPSGTNPSQYCSYAAGLTAGQFSSATINTATSELAIGAFFKNGDKCDANVLLYGFTDNFSPSLENQGTLLSDSYGGGMWLSATRFNWFGNSDQIAVEMELNNPAGVVGVITFNPVSAAMTAYTTSSSSNADIFGMAVGLMGEPASGLTTAADYTPQIAVLSNDFADSNFTPHVKIFTVNAANNDYTPALSQTFTVSNFGFPGDVVRTGGSLVHSGDLQGRSERLGQPVIVRAPSQIQPEVILGHPPMHVDYVLPNEGTAPTIFNFSVLPDEYYSQYDLDTMSSTTSANTSTTSYSYAMSETLNEKAQFGVPLVNSISANVSQSWAQTYNATTSTGSNSYQSSALDVSTSTGFGDELWISTYDFNVYLYPVIGQTVCPDSEPSCSTSEQGPLYVQYSGPDQVVQTVTDGPAAEWYQPVFEPGQVFSYPWSTQQLGLQIANPQPLTGITFYVTDDSGETASAIWTSGMGTNQSSGTTQAQSFDTSNSVTVGTPQLEMEIGGGASITASYDYNDSSANATLNTSSSQVQASTGVMVVKPKDFPDPNSYAYTLAPLILGQPLSAGDVQGSLTSQQVNSTGPLWTAFLADPTAAASGAGSWWEVGPYAQNFDIALNHPQRYTATHSNPNWPSSCIALSSVDITDCAFFNFPDPTDLWSSGFYSMRGLLVTVDGTSGPQRVTANAGEQVYLQARVYNYSLTDMTTNYPNAVVYVRFYRQPWDVTNEAPMAGENSVLLAENTLAPIPSFNSSNTTLPNWSVTSTSLDTTSLADTYQVFWVLVWAEDGSGNMLPELVGHGLSADPHSVTINGIPDVPLEMVEGITVNSPSELPSFSNNLGLLQEAFYILPSTMPTPTPTSASALHNAARHNAQATPSPLLRVENVQLSERTAALGDKVIVSAQIRAAGAASHGFMVSFFDEDPSQTTHAFDVELVSHIRAGETYQVRVPYRAHQTGSQELFVVADRGRSDQAIGRVTLEVPAEPTVTPTITPTATPTSSPSAPPTLAPSPRDSDSCAIDPAPGVGWELLVPVIVLLGASARRRRGVSGRPER